MGASAHNVGGRATPISIDSFDRFARDRSRGSHHVDGGVLVDVAESVQSAPRNF
jgi:hypothetical protein